MTALLEAAVTLAEHGWPVFPCRPGHKAPLGELVPQGLKDATTDVELVRRWWSTQPNANVAVATGGAGRLLVVDIDPPAGADTLAQLEANHGTLPPTRGVATPRGGRHAWLRIPDGARLGNTAGKLGASIDTRGDGGYVLVPPSVVDEQPYRWNGTGPDIATAPDWLVELLTATAVRPTATRREQRPATSGGTPYGRRALEGLADDVAQAAEGRRNHTLNAAGLRAHRLALAGDLDAGDVDEQLAAAAIAAGLGRAEIVATLRSAREGAEREGPAARADSPPPRRSAPTATATPTDHGDTGLDDVGNAARFVRQHGPDVRYLAPLDRWLVWTGTRWADDDRRQVVDLAKATARSILAEAADEPDDDRRKLITRHAAASARKQRIDALLSLATPDVAVVPDELDADGWLLNTPTGTVDLRTGRLRQHDRADLITRTTGATAAERHSPTWLAFLERVLPDGDVRDYLQRLVGVSIVGETREHVLPILWGTGANGKSTFAETLSRALGDYAHTAPVDLLMQGRRDTGAATPELAQLRGRRLVLVAETREDGKLAAERVKAITGGDTITARPLYAQPFSFRPSHTAWLSTNHKPRIPDDGPAIWRRLALIPFTVTIPPAERDADLPARLTREASGVLRWAIDGALAYRTRGLEQPKAVQDATLAYRDAEDTFGAFLAERTEPVGSAKAGDIHTAYADWAADNGAPRLSKQALGERLATRGYRSRRGTKGVRQWDGLTLREVNP